MGMKTHLILLFTGLILGGTTLLAQDTYQVRTQHFNVDKYGVAMQGYDPVSYFEGKPVKGTPSIHFFYNGIRYEFATAAHLQAFKANPGKYEPAYGGWCAYAMGKTGEKVEVDPLKYKIVNGTLYLFYYSIINNTLSKWNEDEAALKTRADKNWISTIKKH